LTATDLGFFLATGVGDCLGVGAGHMIWVAAKKAMGFNVKLENESKVATWLATASLCSGTLWQVSQVIFFIYFSNVPICCLFLFSQW